MQDHRVPTGSSFLKEKKENNTNPTLDEQYNSSNKTTLLPDTNIYEWDQHNAKWWYSSSPDLCTKVKLQNIKMGTFTLNASMDAKLVEL